MTRTTEPNRNTILIGGEIEVVVASMTAEHVRLRVRDGASRFLATLKMSEICPIREDVSVMLTALNIHTGQCKLGLFAPQFKIDRAEIVGLRAEQGEKNGQARSSGGVSH